MESEDSESSGTSEQQDENAPIAEDTLHDISTYIPVLPETDDESGNERRSERTRADLSGMQSQEKKKRGMEQKKAFRKEL